MTGAVASQKVTEAPKGSLRVNGHHPPQSAMAERELDCEAQQAEQGRKSGIVTQRYGVERPLINGQKLPRG